MWSLRALALPPESPSPLSLPRPAWSIGKSWMMTAQLTPEVQASLRCQLSSCPGPPKDQVTRASWGLQCQQWKHRGMMGHYLHLITRSPPAPEGSQTVRGGRPGWGTTPPANQVHEFSCSRPLVGIYGHKKLGKECFLHIVNFMIRYHLWSFADL